MQGSARVYWTGATECMEFTFTRSRTLKTTANTLGLLVTGTHLEKLRTRHLSLQESGRAN